MSPRIFIACTLLVAISAVFSVAAFNFWIDPFMQYRMPSYPPRYSSGFARQINAGLARHAEYDSVLLGSSYVMNFRNSDFDHAFGGKTLSLAMPGMFVSEGSRVLDYASARRPLKRVYFGLDFFAFDETKNNYQFPSYLYDENWLNDAPYVASLDTAKRSINIVLNRATDTFNSDPDMPWAWAKADTPFGRPFALADYKRKEAGPFAPLPLARMKQLARLQLARIARDNPQTEFHFFLPPYSALSWLLDAKQGSLEQLLQFRLFLADLIAQLPNAQLHDFQAMESLICDLDRYGDVGHYGPADNAMMVRAMREGTYRSTADDVRRHNLVLEGIVRQRCGETIPAS